MKIKYLAHAAFLITTDKGLRIITDPYSISNGITYNGINESADVVTVSHNHYDHNNTGAVSGNPVILKDTAEIKGVKFKAVPVYHDTSQGRERGKNLVFCIEYEGLKVCHLGDLGHLLTEKQAAELGKVNILMVPVGGFYTIDAATASGVCEQVKPDVVIPMHYKTPKADMPIAGIEEFLKGKKEVTRPDSSEAEFKAGKLPATTQIIVLKPSK